MSIAGSRCPGGQQADQGGARTWSRPGGQQADQGGARTWSPVGLGALSQPHSLGHPGSRLPKDLSVGSKVSFYL